jgi:hypothetical protein
MRVLAVAALSLATCSAQPPAAARPTFELATIKLNKSGSRGMMISPRPGGRFVARKLVKVPDCVRISDQQFSILRTAGLAGFGTIRYRSQSFRGPHNSLNASYGSSIIGRSAAVQVPSRNKGRGGVCAPGRKDRKAPRRGRMQYAARYDAASAETRRAAATWVWKSRHVARPDYRREGPNSAFGGGARKPNRTHGARRNKSNRQIRHRSALRA